jgi:microcystin degradation protein MlrC
MLRRHDIHPRPLGPRTLTAMALRLMVAMFKHETNTLSPVPTRWEDFSPCAGEAAYALYRRSGYAMAGLLEEAEAMGATVTIPLAARALPSAPVARECDAMLLDLHGVMVAEHHEDGEGELLARIRHTRPGLPIGAALDSHASITDRFVANCSAMTGHRSDPHLDMPETGRRAGRACPALPARR